VTEDMAVSCMTNSGGLEAVQMEHDVGRTSCCRCRHLLSSAAWGAVAASSVMSSLLKLDLMSHEHEQSLCGLTDDQRNAL
jgi:hypothetical protein